MLIPLTGLVSGILLSTAGAPLWVAILLLGAAVLFYLFLSSVSRDPVKSFTRNPYHHVWIFLAFAAVGIFDRDINSPCELADDRLTDIIAIRGHINGVSHTTSGDKAIVEVSALVDSAGRQESVDNMRIILRSEILSAVTDDDILVLGKLNKITDSDNYFNTGYARSQYRKGIYYQIDCNEGDIDVTGHTRTFTGVASSIRDRLEAAIEHTHLNKTTQNFLITVLLGDRAYLDRDTRDLFADAGISHMLALSGMHVAIISGILLWILFPMNFLGLYRYRILVSTILLLFYAFITGWAPSTVRATLMAMSVMVCMFMERKNSAWNALLTATFVILLISPGAVLDVGLQLSFMCVAALIFFVNPLNPIDHHEHHYIYAIYTAVLTTLVATVATWCLVAYSFGMVPVMFLPANILVLPLLPAYLVTAIIYLALSGFGLEIEILGYILDRALNGLYSILDWMSGEGTAINYSPTTLTLILWMVFLILAAWWLNGNRRRWKKWSCILLGCALVVSVPIQADADREDAFIIQRGIYEVTLLSRVNGKENTVSMQNRALSRCTLAGKDIIIADGPSHGMSVDTCLTCDILVIGGGNREELEEITKRIRPQEIVIHASVRRKREAALISEAKAASIPAHSIRREGAYRYPAR